MRWLILQMRNNRTTYRRRLCSTWLVFGLMLTLLAGAYLAAIRHAHQLEKERFAWNETEWQVHGALRAYHGKSVRALEDALNSGSHFARRGNSTSGEWVEVDGEKLVPSAAGWRVRMFTSQHRLYAAHVVTPVPPTSEASQLLVAYAERYRQILIAISALLWVAAIALLPACGNWRPVMAQGALGAAIVSASMWALHHIPTRTWSLSRSDAAAFSGLLLMLALPALAILLHKPTQRAGCVKCRYDLRGNTSGICPECGTQIPPDNRRFVRDEATRYAAALEELHLSRT